MSTRTPEPEEVPDEVWLADPTRYSGVTGARLRRDQEDQAARLRRDQEDQAARQQRLRAEGGDWNAAPPPRRRPPLEPLRPPRYLDVRTPDVPTEPARPGTVGLIAVVAALLLIALSVLGGCAVVVVQVAPPTAPLAPACPTLALDRLRRTQDGEIVLLRAGWPGPGELELGIEQFALMDNNGATYRAGGDDTEVAAGQSAPVVLTAAPVDGGWLVEARLEYEGCPSAVVPLPEPR